MWIILSIVKNCVTISYEIWIDVCTGHHLVRDAYVLPFQDDLGGWDRIEAVEELRAAMVTTESNMGELDRCIRVSAPATNATAWNATALMATVDQTRPQPCLRITGPHRDAALQWHRSREHVLAAAASNQCIREQSSGVAAKQAEDEAQSPTPSTPPSDSAAAVDQDALTPSDVEEIPVGM